MRCRGRAMADGYTKRGVPPDYAGDDPAFCNARTRAGKPCRALGLPGTGRCKWHGGLSTGPRTEAGKQKAALNRLKRLRADVRKWAEARSFSSTTHAGE